MKMKTSALWQAGVCALLLSACGGSGGDSPSINSTPTAQNANVNASNTNNQAAVSNNAASSHSNNNSTALSGSPTATPQANFGGVSTKVVEGNNDYLLQFGTQSATSGSSLNKIILDGKEITLLEPTRNTNGWFNAERGNIEQTLHTGYSYMRFGLHESDERNTTMNFTTSPTVN